MGFKIQSFVFGLMGFMITHVAVTNQALAQTNACSVSGPVSRTGEETNYCQLSAGWHTQLSTYATSISSVDAAGASILKLSIESKALDINNTIKGLQDWDWRNVSVPCSGRGGAAGCYKREYNPNKKSICQSFYNRVVADFTNRAVVQLDSIANGAKTATGEFLNDAEVFDATTNTAKAGFENAPVCLRQFPSYNTCVAEAECPGSTPLILSMFQRHDRNKKLYQAINAFKPTETESIGFSFLASADPKSRCEDTKLAKPFEDHVKLVQDIGGSVIYFSDKKMAAEGLKSFDDEFKKLIDAAKPEHKTSCRTSYAKVRALYGQVVNSCTSAITRMAYKKLDKITQSAQNNIGTMKAVAAMCPDRSVPDDIKLRCLPPEIDAVAKVVAEAEGKTFDDALDGTTPGQVCSKRDSEAQKLLRIAVYGSGTEPIIDIPSGGSNGTAAGGVAGDSGATAAQSGSVGRAWGSAPSARNASSDSGVRPRELRSYGTRVGSGR